MKKLYLDIDGVLITVKNPVPARNAESFISFVTNRFDCYWLTTHCKGDSGTALNYLSDYFDDLTIEQLRFVKPTNWTTLKTEAIDFSSDFFWLDDYPFNAEINILKANRSPDRLIRVNLGHDNELDRILNILKCDLENEI